MIGAPVTRSWVNGARPGAPPCSPFSSHLPSSPLHSAQLEEARGRRGMLCSPALAWQMVRSAASARGPRRRPALEALSSRAPGLRDPPAPGPQGQIRVRRQRHPRWGLFLRRGEKRLGAGRGLASSEPLAVSPAGSLLMSTPCGAAPAASHRILRGHR